MESTIETVFGVILFVAVLSWSLFSMNLYLSANDEDEIRSTLLEYAISIKDYITMIKHINENLTNPSIYGIESKIFIVIKYWEFQYDSNIHLIQNSTYPKDVTIPKFIDKAEALGAFINGSEVFIVFKVIVYGQA